MSALWPLAILAGFVFVACVAGAIVGHASWLRALAGKVEGFEGDLSLLEAWRDSAARQLHNLSEAAEDVAGWRADFATALGQHGAEIKLARQSLARISEEFARDPKRIVAEASVVAEWKAEMAGCRPGSPKHQAFQNRLREVGAL